MAEDMSYVHWNYGESEEEVFLREAEVFFDERDKYPYRFFVPDFEPTPLTRWQRIKRRVRKAFWFLFRDEE